MTERKLHWYVKSEDNPTTHHWSFLIVNTPDEREKIIQRARQTLAPTDDERIVTEGTIPNSNGLHYALITLDSYKRENPDRIDLDDIYQGRKIKDRNLTPHKTTDGLEIYVSNMFESS